MTQPMVSLSGLYKIFGARDKDVLQHVKGGMGKEELLAQHGHVMGLNNINVDMQAGEITVVMGLSGSGKSTLIRHLNRLIEPLRARSSCRVKTLWAYLKVGCGMLVRKRCRWCSRNSRYCRTRQC